MLWSGLAYRLVLHIVLTSLRLSPWTNCPKIAMTNAIFDGPKLQLQYRACKPAAISVRFNCRDIAGVSSNLLET